MFVDNFMQDMHILSQAHAESGSAQAMSHQRFGLMQDSTRLEALLTWMEEEPVQGSILFVVCFTLILHRTCAFFFPCLYFFYPVLCFVCFLALIHDAAC